MLVEVRKASLETGRSPQMAFPKLGCSLYVSISLTVYSFIHSFTDRPIHLFILSAGIYSIAVSCLVL